MDLWLRIGSSHLRPWATVLAQLHICTPDKSAWVLLTCTTLLHTFPNPIQPRHRRPTAEGLGWRPCCFKLFAFRSRRGHLEMAFFGAPAPSHPQQTASPTAPVDVRMVGDQVAHLNIGACVLTPLCQLTRLTFNQCLDSLFVFQQTRDEDTPGSCPRISFF